MSQSVPAVMIESIYQTLHDFAPYRRQDLCCIEVYAGSIENTNTKYFE